jgi:acetyl-CoA acetyltransferase
MAPRGGGGRTARPVAVVSFAQSDMVRREEASNDVEMLQPVVQDVFGKVGLTKDDMGFVCSGSCDYLVGAPFSFVGALDAVGAWPPMRESHVEMDGAFALYEAWTQLQEDDIETALVYSFGRSSMSEIGRVLTLQLDPYYMAPLWPDPVALAALQAQALIDAGKFGEADFAAVAARSRRDGRNNPHAQVTGDHTVDELLGDDYVVSPLRRHALPPAWITGMDHRIETHALGARDLTISPTTRLAAVGAGLLDSIGDGSEPVNGSVEVDVAELHAPFAHQELILRDALGLGDGVSVNPSGGALAANGVMVAGLVRIGEAASRIMDGTAETALAHATSGPCLQQNLVCALAAEPTGRGRS